MSYEQRHLNLKLTQINFLEFLDLSQCIVWCKLIYISTWFLHRVNLKNYVKPYAWSTFTLALLPLVKRQVFWDRSNTWDRLKMFKHKAQAITNCVHSWNGQSIKYTDQKPHLISSWIRLCHWENFLYYLYNSSVKPFWLWNGKWLLCQEVSSEQWARCLQIWKKKCIIDLSEINSIVSKIYLSNSNADSLQRDNCRPRGPCSFWTIMTYLCCKYIPGPI